MPFIDLTRTLAPGMPVYPGDPPVEIQTLKGSPATCKITLGSHAGTHLDAPSHFFKDGKSVAHLDVNKFFGRGRLIDARGIPVIDSPLLDGVSIERGDAVLVYTGWDTHFNSPDYFTQYPKITPAFAQQLCDAGITMIGMDNPGPDYPPYPVHQLFLKHEVIILENLTGLEQLTATPRFKVIALPAKWPTDGAPVRVIAKI